MRRGAELHPIRSWLTELAPIDALRRRAGPRWAPGRGAALAMVLLAVLVAVAAGCWIWAGRPHQLPVGLAAAESSSSAAVSGPLLSAPPSRAAPSPSSPAGVLVVDVVGRVHRPGVYRLPAGSRVTDAVTAAGGVLAGVDPATVNLARKLSDGEQLVIGRSTTAAPTGSAPAGSGSAGPDAPVDLNSATVAQLDALPGVGPVLAQRIVDWRTQHGRFDSVAQLRSVSGIGDAKFADLSPLVTVG